MAIKKKRKAIPKKKPIKKAIKKKVLKKKVTRKQPARKVKRAKENIIGKVTHYFPKVRAAVIKLKAPLAVGEIIKIKGHTTDFKQNITSMQIDRVPISEAKKGDEIGLLVDSRVRQHDIVIRLNLNKGGGLKYDAR